MQQADYELGGKKQTKTIQEQEQEQKPNHVHQPNGQIRTHKAEDKHECEVDLAVSVMPSNNGPQLQKTATAI